MSNRLTTWELKAVDNLPEVIARMQKIADLLMQQAQLSAGTNSAIAAQLSTLKSSYDSVQKSMQTVSTEQQKHTAAVNQQTAASKQLHTQLDSMVSSARNLAAMMGLAFSVSEIKDFIGDTIQAEAKVALLSKSLANTLQNKKLADEIAAYAMEMSTRSPFQVTQIIEVTQRLAAMGAEGTKITTYLEMLGELSSVVGTQKLPLIAKALLDVQNKQKLYAQEIRQFTDNGVPIYRLMADSMDLPVQAVKKLAEQHKISFREVEKALLSATQEGGRYHGMMAMQAETNAGKLSNLTDIIFLAKARFGEFHKEGLGKVIDSLTDFAKSLAGSNSAIERTIDYVKAVTALIITFTTAGKLAAAAYAAKEIVMKAYTIAVGTSHIALQSLTTAMGANITITTAASTTARAFWATLAANPIGLIVTVVGLATSAYYAWQAASTEVAAGHARMMERIRESIAPLELEKQMFNTLSTAVLNSNLSLEERNKKLTELQAKYPLQMAGINNLSDAELRLSALMKEVNNDYVLRIKLLENEIRMQVNNEAAKAAILEKIKLENELGKAKGAVTVIGMDGTAIEISNTKKVIEERIGALNKTIEESQKYNANIAYQNERLTKGINDDWTVKTKANVEGHAAGEDSKKEKAFLTAKEIAVLVKGVQEDSIKEQLALIDARMNLEIERINTHQVKKIKSEADAAEAIKQIVAKAEEEKKSLIEQFNESRKVTLLENLAFSESVTVEEVADSAALREAKIFDDKEAAKVKKESEESKREEGKKTTEAAKLFQQEVAGIHAQEREIIEYNAKVEKQARQDGIKMAIDYLAAQGGVVGELSKIFKRGFEDMDLLNGKTIDSYQNAVKAAKEHFSEVTKLYEVGSQQYDDAQGKVTQSQKDLKDAEIAANKAKLGMVMAIIEVIQAIKDSIVNNSIELNRYVVDVMLRTGDIMKSFYNEILDVSKSSMEAELEIFKGTTAEKLALLEKYHARQLEIAEARDAMDLQIQHHAKTIEINTNTVESINKAWDWTKGPLGPQTLLKIITAWKSHNAELEAAAYEREAKEAEMRVARLQDSIEKARQERDVAIEAIEDELDAFVQAKEAEIERLENFTDTAIDAINTQLDAAKAAYQQQTDAVKDAYDQQLSALKEKESQEKAALQATYDFKRDLLEQSKADENEAITIVDRLRNEALERYRTDETNRLAATRNRILATLTDENERAEVTNAYAQKIADVHKEVEDAKLDKSKGVSLATKQLNQEAKDGAVKLKEEEKEAVNALEQSYQDKFKAMADERDAKLEVLKNDYIARETALKNQITQLQSQLAITVKGLEDDITAKKQDASKQKASAEKDYANFVLSANKQIMQSQIQMAIAQIRAEIAMLQGKRNIFNRGKIDAAVGDLQGSIRDLEALMGEGTGGIVTVPDTWTSNIKEGLIAQRKAAKTPFRADNLEAVGEAYDKSGNQIALTYTDEDRTFTAYDKAGNSFTIRNATGYASATGETFKDGTPYLELNGNPSGVDTIPGWVKGKGIAHFDEGERIVSRKMNALLGGREVSNDELVAKTIFADRILQRTAMKFDTFLAPLPASMLNGATGGSDSRQWEEFADRIVEAVNKPHININVRPGGLDVAEHGRKRQHVDYYKNTPYNRFT